MDLQTLLVAIIVSACAAFALWSLAPAAFKRSAARRLLARRWPAPLAAALQRTARGASGCGCDGCDAGAAARPSPAAPVTLHRRRR